MVLGGCVVVVEELVFKCTFAEREISGMTVCEPGFSIMCFPPSSSDNLSTIWKAHWVLACLFFLVGQCGVKKGAEGREPGVWVLVYLQPAGQSPMHVAGPTVHLYICTCLRNQLGPPFEQEVRSAKSVLIAVACPGYLCMSPQLLSPLLGEFQLSCVP